MKVPHSFTTRTRPADTALPYASGAGITPAAFGAGIAQGLAGLGADVQQIEARTQARQGQTQKFQAMQNLTQFETQVSQNLAELKRNADPTGKDFLRQADEAYTREEQAFLANSVPPELREEFKTRTGEIRQKVIGDSLDFQYKVGDAYFKQGVSDTLNQARTGIARDPGSTDAWRKRLNETIDATDLPTLDKENLKREANISLLKTEYENGIRQVAIDDVVASGAPNGGGVTESFVNKIIGAESGGRATAKNPNSSAEGLGQFIDSTWISMMRKYHPEIGGSNDDLLDLKTDPVLGREMTVRYAQENAQKLQAAGIQPTEGSLYLMHFLGPGAVKVLSANPNTPIGEVVSGSAINANRSVFSGVQTAGDLIAWSDRKMGSSSGASARVTSIMTDPRYDAIPYEDKILLQNDALQQAKAQTVALAQQAKAQQEAQFNNLLNGLNDGTVGASAIDAARQAGWLNDYDQINKAQQVYEQRNETVGLAAQGEVKLGAGGVFDPTDEKDKKMLNAMIGEDGLKAISGADENYITTTVVPMVSKAQDIPTDVMGTLLAMTRSNNQTQALFALDTLAQLREASPGAFDARTDEKLARDVDFYNARKNLYPADELMRLINPNVSQAERQVQESLRKEARDILSTKSGNVPHIKELVSEFADDQGDLSGVPGALNVLEAEFQPLFEDAYARYGNEADATKAATEALKRTWAVTTVGNGTLMKFPPEKVGYKPIFNSYEWINDQVRSELKLPEGGAFELFSDAQTEQEFNRWKGTPNAPAPSYRVVQFDENGVPTESRLPNGKIRRMNFVPSEALKAREAVVYDHIAEERAQAAIITDYANARHQAAMTHQEIPEDIEKAYLGATKRLEELKKSREKIMNESFSNEPLPETSFGGAM